MKKLLFVVLIAAMAVTAQSKTGKFYRATCLAEQLSLASDAEDDNYNPQSAYMLAIRLDSLMRRSSKRTILRLKQNDITFKWVSQMRKDACKAAFSIAQTENTVDSYNVFLHTYTRSPAALRQEAKKARERLLAAVDQQQPDPVAQ